MVFSGKYKDFSSDQVQIVTSICIALIKFVAFDMRIIRDMVPYLRIIGFLQP